MTRTSATTTPVITLDFWGLGGATEGVTDRSTGGEETSGRDGDFDAVDLAAPSPSMARSTKSWRKGVCSSVASASEEEPEPFGEPAPTVSRTSKDAVAWLERAVPSVTLFNAASISAALA